MRRALFISVTLFFLSACGCAGPRVVGFSQAPPSPSLLFDTVRGWPKAADVASRSTWPSTGAYLAGDEEIVYREHFIDRQGNGWWRPGRDWVYRRFETVRTGRGRR